MSTEETELAVSGEKSEARFFGIASAILLVILIASSNTFLTALILLGLAATTWKLLFHGATFISLSVHGKSRTYFQVAVSIIFPVALSLYFLASSSPVSVGSMFSHLFSLWFLIPLLVIGYTSKRAAMVVNRRLPFRSFLIASTIIFAICFMGHNGIVSEYDDSTESNYTFIDKESAKSATESGRYFGQFLVYVLVSYGAMLWGLRKQA